MQQITALILRSLVLMDVAGKQRFFCLFVFVGRFHLAKTFENVCATKQKSHFPFLYHFNGFIMAKFSTRRSDYSNSWLNVPGGH